jgi:hypothetical protein
MSETKHTPGKWLAEDGRIYAEDGHAIAETTGRVIDKLGCHWVASEEAQANARLIASAPELLEALQELREWGVAEYQSKQMPNGCVLESILVQADQAIAKATGKGEK